MATLADRFVGDLFDKFGLFAPWLPNVPVALGAVGVLEDGVFVRKTSLANLDIAWKPAPLGPQSVLDYASAKGVTIRMKAKGSALDGTSLALVEAGASIEFARTGAVVLQASGVRVRGMDDADAVGRAILERFRGGLWDEDWVFVDEVHEAASTTILVSEERAARMDLRATGELATTVPLAGSFVIAAKQGSITVFLGEKGLTPLFRLSRVTKSWLASLLNKPATIGGARRAAPRRPRAALPAPNEPLLEHVTLRPRRARRG